MEDINILREIVTVASFLAFAAIVVYALWPANRERFDAAARLPLVDDEPSPGGEGAKAGHFCANGSEGR